MFILLNVIPTDSLSESLIKNYLDLDELKICLRKSNLKECRKLILIMEKLQIEASNNGNYKCQSTLLGIQTELIKNVYSEKNNIFPETIISSNLIKNC